MFPVVLALILLFSCFHPFGLIDVWLTCDWLHASLFIENFLFIVNFLALSLFSWWWRLFAYAEMAVPIIVCVWLNRLLTVCVCHVRKRVFFTVFLRATSFFELSQLQGKKPASPTKDFSTTPAFAACATEQWPSHQETRMVGAYMRAFEKVTWRGQGRWS